jgi:hypothetical protein
MNFRTLMQAGPAKANELFARLAETSDGALKTREKLFTELKSELELHTSLEEQHLFPILKRNAETKGLVADAIKDNKELRAKLAELEVLPKNEETFPERLKELQKTFRQHARDDKRELLPAVQRALSEEQVQDVAEKMEATVAEAEQAKQDEAEERRAKARQEREKVEQHAEQQEAAAEQAAQNEVEQKRAEVQHKRDLADIQAEQEAMAPRTQSEARHPVPEATETTARTAGAAKANVLRVAESATDGAQRVGAELRGAVGAYTEAALAMMPDAARIAASQPGRAIGSMTEIRSAWMEWLGQMTRAGTQISQDLLRQTAEQQQRFAVIAIQNWVDHSARVMQITQEGLRSFASRPTAGPDHNRRVR